MGGERQGPKAGGYVGGFLQLFDWNAKSRKKLFSSKSDNPDQSKQKKRREGNIPKTRFNLVEMDEDEYVAASSFKGSSDYSCASSVTDEEGFGPRAPSVVARLMGLDSMPSSNYSETFSTPFFDSQSLRESQRARTKLEYHQENQSMHSGNLRMKVDAPVQKAQRMLNMPIEKFQREILPPKSAKSIPITHHKLLSPIKSPGFISSKHAAHIMEAAAKIIEPGPQATNKNKMPSVGGTSSSSSVPFKVRELREKVEASQKPSRRPVESNAANILKGQPMNKSWNGSPDVSEDRRGVNKGKSISLALQAKVNVQKREGRKETSQLIVDQPFKSQTSNQKIMQKRSSTLTNTGILRQNNQKQNCRIDKEKLISKTLVSSNTHGRSKILSGDSSSMRGKNSSRYEGYIKVGSRKLSSEAKDSKEEVLYTSTRNVPRKRRSLDGNSISNRNQIVDSMVVDTNESQIQAKPVSERQFAWVEESERKEMDVVSFTFTTPLSRQTSDLFGSDYRGKKVTLSSDSRKSGKMFSVGCNVIGADDLSILLEQKLRELTHGADSTRFREEVSRSSVSLFQDSARTLKEEHDMAMSYKKKNQDTMHIDILGGDEGLRFTSTDGKGIMNNHKIQGMMEAESDDTETRKSLYSRRRSPVSILEPSIMTESWNSSDTADSINVEGSKQGSSVQALEVVGINSYKNLSFMDRDAELSDSASSSSMATFTRGKRTAISTTSLIGSNWELQYVNEILFNVGSMFKDFALGRACEIIKPHLFNQLENRKESLKEDRNENKIERKVLFDCVSECIDLKSTLYAKRGFKMWAKGLSTFKRKEQLAADVCKEILGWKGTEDSMVDNLVDKDMSSQYGKWLDFDVEAFELGVEIEDRILNSLVDEVITDLLI